MGAVENVKEIAEMIGKFHDIELNRRILKLENEVMDLARDKRRAEETIEELRHTLGVKENLVFEGNDYFIQRENEKEGPYCSACWDRDKKLIRLHSAVIGRHPCPVCAKEIVTKHR